MDALLVSIPKAPRIPHDLEALLSYQAPQRSRHVRRCGENAARHMNLDLEGTTQADEL